jgi:hypothetical protein
MSGDRRIVTATGANGEQIVVENPSSVELNLTAKGQVTFVVKCYDADPEVAAERASKVFRSLSDQYADRMPRP